MAMTFVSLAKTTWNPDTCRRNIENARKAHDQVMRLLSGGLATGDQKREEIQRSLDELNGMLREFARHAAEQ